ncbi:MAG: TonB-dependent receptor [Bacteroidota bacterium]
MRKLPLIYVFLVFSALVGPINTTIQAQVTLQLSGLVLHAQTREPLPGATLSFSELRRSVQANEKGFFIIEGIGSGHHVVEVTYAGFATQVLHLEMTQSQEMNFLLVPVFLENQGVVVTGTTAPTNLRKIPIPITIFRQSDLMKTAASNIVDALSQLPGVSQITTGPAISKPLIRGLGSNRVVVVNDGIRQEGQQWGDEHGLEIDELSIQKIEVVKGPASLLYGSDALAGVIHFQTAPPVEEGTVKGRLLSNYQTNGGLLSSHLRLAGNKNGFNWSGYGSIKSSGDYHNKLDGPVLNARFNENNWGGQVGINKKWGYSQLHFSNFDQRLGVVEGERDASTGQFILFGGTPLERIATAADLSNRAVLVPNQRVQHAKLVSENAMQVGKSRLKFSLGMQQNKRREYGEAEAPDEEELFFDLRTLNYNFQWQLPEQKEWHTTMGVNGMHQTNQNKGEEVLIPAYQLFDAGVFLYAQRFMKSITWSGGLRLDSRSIQGSAYEEGGQLKFPDFKKQFSNWSGSVGFSYEPSTDVVLKVNIARGFRAPSLPELASNGTHEGTNRYEYGRLDLQSETSWQGDAGLDLEYEHFGLSATIFYNHINDFIFYRKLNGVAGGDSIIQVGGDALTAFIFQQQNASLAGMEFTLDIHPHPIHWLHIENTFSLVRGRFSKPIDNSIAGSEHLPLIPAPRWNTELRGDFEKGFGAFKQVYFRFTTQAVFEQDRFFSAYQTETATPGYLLMDVGLGGNWVDRKKNTLASFHLSVTNVGDVAWQSHTSRLKYTAENGANGLMGVFNRGRNLSLRIAVPFSWKK